MNRLAIKIKEARLKANMSEKDLAKACGQNINYILQIESGKKVINEHIAENILKILGEKVEFFGDVESQKQDESKAKLQTSMSNTQAKPNTQKQSTPPVQAITPNEEWQGALAGIIKSYPIQEERSAKVVGYKDLPILSKKIDGFHYEKVLFIKVTDSELSKYRIQKQDVVMAVLANDIQGQGVYYIEVNRVKMIKYIVKTQNNRCIYSSGSTESEVEVDLKDVKILGRVVKVEFNV